MYVCGHTTSVKINGTHARPSMRCIILVFMILWPENGRIRACAAEQRSILTQLGPISCRSALTRATASVFRLEIIIRE